ncbi:DUF6207 family protein [Streptomyces gobitricini]|uniref:Uncharacterized protein n=1 Tax=Streptomyces gobitricini TaxID=68211 RepID=A0ABN3M9H0_9ACTN
MHIGEQLTADPGLVVLDVAAADGSTIREVMEGLQQQWATSGIPGPAYSGRGGGQGADVGRHPAPRHRRVDGAEVPMPGKPRVSHPAGRLAQGRLRIARSGPAAEHERESQELA